MYILKVFFHTFKIRINPRSRYCTLCIRRFLGYFWIASQRGKPESKRHKPEAMYTCTCLLLRGDLASVGDENYQEPNQPRTWSTWSAVCSTFSLMYPSTFSTFSSLDSPTCPLRTFQEGVHSPYKGA